MFKPFLLFTCKTISLKVLFCRQIVFQDVTWDTAEKERKAEDEEEEEEEKICYFIGLNLLRNVQWLFGGNKFVCLFHINA